MGDSYPCLHYSSFCCKRMKVDNYWMLGLYDFLQAWNMTILKEVSPRCSLEGLMLKLKLQHFGHLMRRVDSLGKTLMLGKTEGKKRRGWQDAMVGWHHWHNGHHFEQTPGDSEGQGNLVCCSPWGREELDTTEWLHFHFSLHALEKEMATHSSVLAWRIPGTREPGGLPSMGSRRVRHDWSDLAAAAAAAVLRLSVCALGHQNSTITPLDPF